MSRKDDVVRSFMKSSAVTVIESEKILTLLEQAVSYGFEQGESFGKYGAFIEKQNEKMAEAIIQPENDKVWREKLDNIMKSKDDVPWAQQTVDLLGLIADILLVRKNGG